MAANGAASTAPFFADMVAEGATDYIALPLQMSDGVDHASSFVTREKGGFDVDPPGSSELDTHAEVANFDWLGRPGEPKRPA